MLTDVTPLRDELVGRVEPVLLLLFVCVSLVLLVACVNVANLLLARAAGRQTEISVRVALGAGRARLVRQLLTESGLLAVAGGALGLVAAHLGLPLLLAGIPARERAGMPFLETLEVDGRVLGYGAGVILLTTLLFGLLPALRASRSGSRLGDDATPTRAGLLRVGIRDLLVTAEIALAVMLLGSAGLMGKSLLRALSTDPGFRPEGLVGLELSLVEPGAPDRGGLAVAQGEGAGLGGGRFLGVSLAARVNRMPATGRAVRTASSGRNDHPPPGPSRRRTSAR